MRRKTDDHVGGFPRLLFLNPLVYRPLKVNFARRFALLSRWYIGHIFALSGSPHRNLRIGNFLFHSESSGGNSISRLARALWVQTAVPLRLLRNTPRVDAIIAYDPYRSGLAALVLKYLLGGKLIVELNGDYHKCAPGGNRVKRFLMRSLLTLVLRSADAIKVLNSDQHDFCRRRFPRKPVYQFPDFVASAYFESLTSYQGRYLLSVGHPFDLKGVDILIEAFRRVADRHPGATLRIMGYCPEHDLEKYNKIAQGDPRIEFIKPGWIEDVGEQMRGCYALVNAARSEAMGRVHVEAMACGKPIVATRTNGALQCVEDGLTGLLCEINDTAGLSEKLDQLLSNPEGARQMGQAARDRMRRQYSEGAYVTAFRSMLREVTDPLAVVSNGAQTRKGHSTFPAVDRVSSR